MNWMKRAKRVGLRIRHTPPAMLLAYFTVLATAWSAEVTPDSPAARGLHRLRTEPYSPADFKVIPLP